VAGGTQHPWAGSGPSAVPPPQGPAPGAGAAVSAVGLGCHEFLDVLVLAHKQLHFPWC